MLITSFITLSQSNPIDLSLSFVKNPDFAAGLDEISRQGDIFQISVSMGQEDLNSLGAMTIFIYDQASSAVIYAIPIDQEQLLNGTFTHEGVLIFSFPRLNPNGAYKVILDIQNTQQAYLPRVEKNYPTN